MRKIRVAPVNSKALAANDYLKLYSFNNNIAIGYLLFLCDIY